MGLWELVFGKSEAQKQAEETARIKAQYRKGKSGPWSARPSENSMHDETARNLNSINRQHGGTGRWF